MEYIPVGKKESDSCIILRSDASTMMLLLLLLSSVLMYIHPLFGLKDHFSLAYLQMIQDPTKYLFEHLDFRIRLYWKIDLSSLKLDWSM
jgi:hypothetical protein